MVLASIVLSMLLEDGSGEVVSGAVKESWMVMAVSISLHLVPVQAFSRFHRPPDGVIFKLHGIRAFLWSC